MVTLTSIANPVACLTSLFLAVSSPWAISSLTSMGVACGAYIIVAATMSPYPPMVEQAAGGPVVVSEDDWLVHGLSEDDWLLPRMSEDDWSVYRTYGGE